MTLLDLFKLLKRHLKFVLIVPILLSCVVGAYSIICMPNQFTARTSMYVLAKDGTQDAVASNGNLQASQLLANDMSAIVSSDRVRNDAAKALHMKDLSDFDISVSSDTTTRVISVSVTGDNPQEVSSVANEIAASCSSVAVEVMDVDSVNVIDRAQAPANPSGPNRALYTAAAFVGGLFFSVGAVVLKDMLDTRVHDADQLEELLNIPVIGRVPAVKGVK